MAKRFRPNIMNIVLACLVIVGIIVVVLINITNPQSSTSDYSKTKTETLENSDTTTSETETTTIADKQAEPAVQKKDSFEGLTLTNEDIGVPVLYYHSVNPSEANEVTISPTKLKEQLQFVKDSGYTTLTMAQFNDYIANSKPIPVKSILITFDDGYMDNYTNAFPILKELGMNATIFVITSGIDDGYYLSTAQIKEMSDYGIDIQSHTSGHYYLNQLTYDKQLTELKTSKAKIEGITNKPVTSVAYPFGASNANTEKAVKEAGYTIAFTTKSGLANRTDTAIKLDRVYINSKFDLNTFKDRLLNTKK
jgi:peptidoglycan/xylan/chitin deacetylase (PgdA/CDA1 family)